jgi:hypothetical protein
MRGKAGTMAALAAVAAVARPVARAGAAPLVPPAEGRLRV